MFNNQWENKYVTSVNDLLLGAIMFIIRPTPVLISVGTTREIERHGRKAHNYYRDILNKQNLLGMFCIRHYETMQCDMALIANKNNRGLVLYACVSSYCFKADTLLNEVINVGDYLSKMACYDLGLRLNEVRVEQMDKEHDTVFNEHYRKLEEMERNQFGTLRLIS